LECLLAFPRFLDAAAAASLEAMSPKTLWRENFSDRANIRQHDDLVPPNLEMGEYAVIGWRTLCYSMDRVVIGDYAIVSQCSFLLAGTHDIDDLNFQLQTKPIHIGRRAWVAACAIVGPGVTIGEGAVLGGGGVAFKDLEPWTVYAGNPARKLRARKLCESGTES
jgi:acetyltransferase-like isoleucine patch superfamily enzyme